MERTSSASTKLVIAVAACVFAVILYRSVTQPVTIQEARTFEQLIYPPFSQALGSHDLATSLLTVFLTKRTVALLRLSEFSFRLPSLLALPFYFWAVFRVIPRAIGQGVAVCLPLALPTAALLPLAFFAWTVRFLLARNLSLAGLCLGFAVACNLTFAIPAALLAAAALIFRGQHTLVEIVERFAFTFLAVAFVFTAIPLSTAIARPSPKPPSAGPAAVRSLVSLLRSREPSRPLRVAVSPSLKPVVAFYRARDRFSNWPVLAALPDSGSFDYYLLEDTDQNLISDLHLTVVSREPGLTLARPGGF